MKKAQMAVQVEAVKVQKELAAYEKITFVCDVTFLVFLPVFLPALILKFSYFSCYICRTEIDGYCEGELIKVSFSCKYAICFWC